MPSIALPVSLRGQLLSGTRTIAFSPVSLFSANEPGVWFDPSDLTTLFTDPAGTTAVTTPGQTVGLMLDKSKGLALGPELVSNGDFSGGTTGWLNNTASLSVVSSKLRVSNSSNFGDAYQAVTTVIGKTYLATSTSQYVSGILNESYLIKSDNSGASSNTILSSITEGAKKIIFVATATTTYILLQGQSANAVFDWSAVSVRELAGNHATQATLAARPTYSVEPVGGRRNRLLWTEDLTNAIWTKNRLTIASGVSDPNGGTSAFTVTATDATGDLYQAGAASNVNHKNSIWVRRRTGTGVIQMRNPQGQTFEAITVTSEWQRFTSNVGLPFGGKETYTGIRVLTTGDAVDVYGAQCELGSTATPYQRVTTQHDVTEAGVASLGYLYFDGTDDRMVTSAVTLGIDKVQVFAGLRQLTNQAYMGIVKLGALVSDAGSFLLWGRTSGTGGFEWYSTGSGAGGGITETANPAMPRSSVVTATTDLSASGSANELALRANGGPLTVTPFGDGGTGNFGNWPLTIGQYGDNNRLHGHLYSLITRFGPTLDAPTITSTEIWVGDKTGIDIAKFTSATIYTRSGDTILDRANSTIERRA